MYYLYYLLDQTGPIDGDKVFIGSFLTQEDAGQKALDEEMGHYSIERVEGMDATIVFKC